MHIVIVLAVSLVGLLFLLSRLNTNTNVQRTKSEFVREISESQFKDMVIGTSEHTPVLVDFYADWCPPCKMLTPILTGMADKYQGAFLLAKINSDHNERIKAQHGVEGIPAVFLYMKGEVVDSFVGGKQEHSVKHFLASNGIYAP